MPPVLIKFEIWLSGKPTKKQVPGMFLMYPVDLDTVGSSTVKSLRLLSIENDLSMNIQTEFRKLGLIINDAQATTEEIVT